MIKDKIRAWTRKNMYPNKNSKPIWKDPTYGKIDRDIQWLVNDTFKPTTLGLRVVAENNLQKQRNKLYESGS